MTNDLGGSKLCGSAAILEVGGCGSLRILGTLRIADFGRERRAERVVGRWEDSWWVVMAEEVAGAGSWETRKEKAFDVHLIEGSAPSASLLGEAGG